MAPNATNATVAPIITNATMAPNVTNATADPNMTTTANMTASASPIMTTPTTTSTTTTPATTTTTTTMTTTTTTTRRPSTDCGFTMMSNAYRVTVLGMHNNFRSAVATGRMRNGEYANENAPPSSRMDLMIYDCAAEQHAFNHVRGCSGGGSIPIARPGYDENIHVLRTTATDDLGAIQNAIATWIIELTGHGIPSNMVFAPHVAFRQSRVVTHVSKILWGTNRRVGCATIRCSTFYFTQCLYQNPVNIVGASIYQIGAVCSACPAGINNCNLAIGLCSWQQ